MKHIVFVLGSYYPRFSAVGVCAHRVINALKGEFKISVLAMADEQAVEPHLVLDGVDIYRVATPEIEYRIALNRRLRSASSRLDRMRLLALRARSTLRRLVSPVTIDKRLVEAYKRQLGAIPKMDLIVPLVFPFESVIAALDYAASLDGVAVVPYIFDNFVTSRSLHVIGAARSLKRRRHLELEAAMLERSAAVLSMHPLEAHFRSNFGDVVDRKLAFLEHPLLFKTGDCGKLQSTSMRLVYTGALIKNVREANYVLDLIDGLDLGGAADADFYVMGNAAADVQTKTALGGVRIRNHGQVSKQEANSAVENASILLNIGEIEGRQISSKIFEYMSAGKPVIHFAYVEDDAVTKILQRYPLALCLLQDREQMGANRERFRQFALANAGTFMEFDAVASIFPEALPETTAKLLARIATSGNAEAPVADTHMPMTATRVIK
jgi:hypothetical protein